MDEIDSVLRINRDFYRAFARGDIGAMEALWSRADEISCIHPGWQALLDRKAVMQSFRAILADPPSIRCVGTHAFVNGPIAHVVCYEMVGNGVLVATNILRQEQDGAWRMIHHQAGPAPSLPETAAPAGQPIH